EGAQEDVVDDHEQRGHAPDAVESGQPRSVSVCTHDGYRGIACEPKALRKRSRNALIGQTGARGLGCRPPCQPHPAMSFITLGSWAMIETGTSRLAPSPLTVVAG